MAERLSKKQREFLKACDLKYDANPLGLVPDIRDRPYYFGPMQMDHWNFWSQSEAERFADRLEARGLLRREKDFFLWITDAGRAAIA